nr:DUF2207 domain-containing protein [Bifidobacterium sp. ESL0784]
MELAAHRSDVSLQWTIPETVSAKSLRFDISMTLKNALTRCGNRTYFLYDTGSNVNGPVEHVAVRLKLPPHVTGEPEGFIDYSGNQTVRRKGLREIDMDTYNVRTISGPAFAFMFDASGMGAIKHDVVWNSEERKFFDKGSVKTDEGAAGCSKDSAVSGSSARSGCSDTASNGGDSNDEADDESTSSSDWLPNASQFMAVLVLVLIFGIVIIIITNRQTSWKGDIPYNEDLPSISPASAAMFIDVVEPKTANTSTLSRRNTREMLSTLLSLAQKKAIALYPGAASWYSGLDLANAGEDEIRACAKAGRAERNMRAADAGESSDFDRDFAGHAGNLDNPDNLGDAGNLDNVGARQVSHRRPSKSERAQSLLSRALWRTRLGWIIRQHPRLARFFGNISKPADGRTVTVRLFPSFDGKWSAASTSGLAPSELALLKYLQDFAAWQGSQVFDLNQLRNSTQSWDENAYARHGAKWSKPGELAHRPADPQLVWTEGVKARQTFFRSVNQEYNALKLVRLSALSALSVIVIGTFVDLGYHILLEIWNMGHQEAALALGLPSVFLVAMVFTLIQYSTLTGDGRRAEKQLLGLMKYMKDFSDFSKRDVESLSIWGQYLIYAVALGMDTEVMRQLKFHLPSNLYMDD